MKRRGLLLMMLAVLAGCPGGPDGLRGGERGLDALGTALVAALSARDHDAALRLLVDRREHDEVYWAALPESRLPGAADPGFAFENMRLRTLRDLRRAENDLAQRGAAAGRLELRLHGLAPTEVQTEGGIRLHRGLHILVSVNDGPPEPLPLTGTAIEHAGRFKMLTYRR